MQKTLTIIFILFLTGCGPTKPISKSKTLDFGVFTIETPNSWTKIERNGTDSYVGSIAIDERDTLHFDVGWYSNNLYEYDPTILDSGMIKDLDLSIVDTSEIIFVKNQRLVDRDKYRKNNISWDTIDGRKVKIVYPRRSGLGMTGVYIDSMWLTKGEIDKFNLYGNNLKPDNEKKLLQVIKTLKFHH